MRPIEISMRIFSENGKVIIRMELNGKTFMNSVNFDELNNFIKTEIELSEEHSEAVAVKKLFESAIKRVEYEYKYDKKHSEYLSKYYNSKKWV